MSVMAVMIVFAAHMLSFGMMVFAHDILELQRDYHYSDAASLRIISHLSMTYSRELDTFAQPAYVQAARLLDAHYSRFAN